MHELVTIMQTVGLLIGKVYILLPCGEPCSDISDNLSAQFNITALAKFSIPFVHTNKAQGRAFYSSALGYLNQVIWAKSFPNYIYR